MYTWEVPRFTLVEINNCYSFRCEANIRNLAAQIVRDQLFICRMESEPWRKTVLHILNFLIQKNIEPSGIILISKRKQSAEASS